MTEQPIPTTECLALALEEAGAPQAMIARARAGYYDDFKSNLATPIAQLVMDAYAAGLDDIADRAMNAEFDATREESDAWMRSPEGQETVQHFLGSMQPKPKNPHSSKKRRR